MNNKTVSVARLIHSNVYMREVVGQTTWLHLLMQFVLLLLTKQHCPYAKAEQHICVGFLISYITSNLLFL